MTFDDGPGTRLTTSILELLAEHNVKATFFLLGRNIQGREQIVREIDEQGHQIASHGYNHLHHWKASPIRAIRDIKQGWQAIDKVLGKKDCVYPFRPPYGKLNLFCLLYLWVRQIPIVYWTLDSGDTWPRNKQNSQKIPLWARNIGEAVILAHDFDRSDDSMDQLILEYVRSVIAMAKETGMQTLTCSELLNQCK